MMTQSITQHLLQSLVGILAMMSMQTFRVTDAHADRQHFHSLQRIDWGVAGWTAWKVPQWCPPKNQALLKLLISRGPHGADPLLYSPLGPAPSSALPGLVTGFPICMQLPSLDPASSFLRLNVAILRLPSNEPQSCSPTRVECSSLLLLESTSHSMRFCLPSHPTPINTLVLE